MVENAEITDLKVKPGHVITVKENGGILAGRAKHSVIRNVTVNGTLRTTGTVGGVTADVLEDSVVENCVSDHVAIDAGSGKEIFIGGIAGRASESLIADCEVNTGDSLSARIQGGGYVGGIAGFQNSADIFNSHVMGTIGGSGASLSAELPENMPPERSKWRDLRERSRPPDSEVRRGREPSSERTILGSISAMVRRLRGRSVSVRRHGGKDRGRSLWFRSFG